MESRTLVIWSSTLGAILGLFESAAVDIKNDKRMTDEHYALDEALTAARAAVDEDIQGIKED